MTTTKGGAKLSRRCKPKWATPRRPDRPTFGPRLARVAAALGTPFMPWQRMVADVGGEYDPDTGIPYYREVIVTVPRQSGKTTLFLSFQIDRCLNWSAMPHRPSPVQRSIYTAQSGADAREKWIDELFPQVRQSALYPTVRQINEGNGNESLRFKTGSVIRLGSSSNATGHSKTLDQGVLDEIWHDKDGRREAGMRPAMATREDAQVLVCSTAGTAFSIVYHRKVAAGRAAVGEDRGRGVAYFEYSAPEGWDPYDEESWWTFMPALGHTITPATVRAELDGMDSLAEFIRAYGNIPTAGSDSVIPAAAWRTVVDPTAKPIDPVKVGFEVSEDRQVAAIATKGSNNALELVYFDALDGAVAEVNRLCDRWDTLAAIDGHGPASTEASSLDAVYEMSTDEVAEACGSMYDAIGDGLVRFRQDDAFDRAAEGVSKRRVGDRFVWHRSGSATDPSPLWAATLAYACPDKPDPVAPFAL